MSVSTGRHVHARLRLVKNDGVDHHINMMMLFQAIWPGVIQRHGGEVDTKFDFSTLAHISEGYSSGTVDQASG